MTFFGDALKATMHADSLALAEGRELSAGAANRVLGQIGLVVCGLDKAVLSPEAIRDIAEESANLAAAAAVKKHVEECMRGGVAANAAIAAAASTPALSRARAWVGLISWKIVAIIGALSFSARGPELVKVLGELLK